MAVRTGALYLASLERQAPCVYFDGQRVDVTTHPIFDGPRRTIAEQYDMQLEPAHRDVMTYSSPTTGAPVSTSFLVPRTRDELVKKRKHFKLRADRSFGFMGRAPDFMNQFVTGLHLLADHFARVDERFGANATRIYEQCREDDLFSTHMLINPQVDRSKTSAEQEDPFLHLGRVGETSEGIIVRGAKMLGTMAPLAEQVVVLPFGGVPPGDDRYALAFVLPSSTKNLRFVCRETVAPGPRSHFDHPLSSRFEEMDCIAIFDDVLVPWDRVLIDGRPGSGAVVNGLTNDFNGLLTMQMVIRMLSQMEFFCGLAMKLADAVGITGFLHVQEKLGEMLSHLEVARAVIHGAEAAAEPHPSGVWLPDAMGLRAFHLQIGKIYGRFVEIVQILGAGGFFYAPSASDFASAELRPLLDKYVRGRPGVTAEERVALFKLAWDATGDTFGQRMAQYVRFYAGDPIRVTAGFYEQYDKRSLFEIVDRALESPALRRGEAPASS